MFAIVQTGGKQYKVAVGDKVVVEKLDVEAGKAVKLEEVLLVSDDGKTEVGMPFVAGAAVQAKVLAHGRGEKIEVFKMKAKKRYQVKQGHRQDETTLEITKIDR